MASKHQTPDIGGEDMCVGLNFIAELLAERYLLKEEKKKTNVTETRTAPT